MGKLKIKWLKKFKLQGVLNITRGDTLTVKHIINERTKTGQIKTTERELINSTMKKDLQADTVGVFQFKDWEGMSEGYGGVIGKEKKEE